MKWSDYPLLRLAVALTLGILAAERAVPHVSSIMLFALSCVMLACMMWIFMRSSSTLGKDKKGLSSTLGTEQKDLSFTSEKDKKGLSFSIEPSASPDKKGSFAFGLSAMLLSFIFGMFLYVARFERMARSVGCDAEQYEGVVKGVPKEKRKSWMVRLVDAKRYDVVLYIGKDSAHLDEQRQLFASVQEGDTIRANARFVHPVANADTTNLRYTRWLLHSGVCATAYVPKNGFSLSRYDGRFVGKELNDGVKGVNAWAKGVNARTIQRKLHELYEENGIDGEAGDVIEAMSIGWRAHLSESVRKSYSRAGASHMLALSGFHVGIIMMLIQGMLMISVLRRRNSKIINGLRVLSVVLLWSFIIMAGASPSLVRAGVMCTLAMVASLYYRSSRLLTICLCAYVLMLCVNPMSLFDVGFQLSFLSVAGISAYSEIADERISLMPLWLRLPCETIAISLVCSIVTAPLVAHIFGLVSLVSVASNLAAFLLLYAIVIGAFLWWMILCCPPVNEMITSFLMWAASALNGAMDYLSSLPIAAVEWRPGTLVTLVCYAVMLSILYVLKSIMKENADWKASYYY